MPGEAPVAYICIEWLKPSGSAEVQKPCDKLVGSGLGRRAARPFWVDREHEQWCGHSDVASVAVFYIDCGGCMVAHPTGNYQVSF